MSMDKPTPQEPKQIDHSDDKIVEKFGSTPLGQAPLVEFPSLQQGSDVPVEIDFLKGNMPVAEYIPPTEYTFQGGPTIEAGTKKSHKRLYAAIAAVAGVVVAGGAVFGITNAPQAPKSEPVATAPANPNPVAPAPVEVAPANPEGAQSAEIPASTEPGLLGEVFTTKITNWVMFNTGNKEINDGLLLAYANGTITTDKDYFGPIAEAEADKQADALFVEGWRNNPELKKWRDLFESKNLNALELSNSTTDSGNSNDVKPFSYSFKLNEGTSTTVLSKTDENISIQATATEHVNLSENRSAALDPTIEQTDGNQGLISATLVREGATLKISSLNIVSPK